MEDENFWIKDSNTIIKHKLLLSTEAQLVGEKNIRKVEIYDSLITFDDMCLIYSFDLKFSTLPNQIKFELINN